MSKTQNLKEMIEYPRDGVLSKELVRTKSLNATLFCMAKNTEISEHTSKKEGIVYVIEGKGIFNLEEKEIKMLPGVLIHMNKDAVHSLKAEENTSFLLILS